MLAFLFCLCGFPTVEAREFSPELQRTVLAATVRILDRDTAHEASGVLIGVRDEVGFILTAHHAVASSTKIDVQFFTNTSYPKPTVTLQADRQIVTNPIADLAMVRVSMKGMESVPTPLGLRQEAPKEKDFAALSTGASRGREPTPEAMQVRGRKLLQRPDGTSAFFWHTREAPVEGRSGGPLVDPHGQLLGIASGTQQNEGFYTHQDEIRAWLRKADRGQLAWLLTARQEP